MSWAKFDDRYDDNRKMKRAWRKDRASVGVHAMAITYCSRHRTDGIVDIDWLADRLPASREREKTLGVLVDVGLFEPLDDGEHWYVHDYLEYNPSRQAREEASDAARNAALTRWSKEQDAKRTPQPHADGNAARNAERMRDPMPHPSRPVPAPTAMSDGSDLRTVFDEWVNVTSRTGATVFSDKRRRVIRRALADYPLADVLDAVRGWRNSPHHRGENDTRTVYNDIELLLRDAAHIERFRDLQRAGNGRREPTLDELHAAMKRRDAAA